MTAPQVPEHMREYVEFGNHWSPRWYHEAVCGNCANPIYRYEMDIVVEWRHFNHDTYCGPLRATPAAVGVVEEHQP